MLSGHPRSNKIGSHVLCVVDFKVISTTFGHDLSEMIHDFRY